MAIQGLVERCVLVEVRLAGHRHLERLCTQFLRAHGLGDGRQEQLRMVRPHAGQIDLDTYLGCLGACKYSCLRVRLLEVIWF